MIGRSTSYDPSCLYVVVYPSPVHRIKALGQVSPARGLFLYWVPWLHPSDVWGGTGGGGRRLGMRSMMAMGLLF
jgi:hypothetical protein